MMSIKGYVGTMIVGIALGAAVCTVFPMPVSKRNVRHIRRYIKNML